MVKKIVLKLNSKYFEDVLNGKKPFEIRYDDKQYNVGDFLVMKEWDNDKEEYTGRVMVVRITYISTYKQQSGYVVLGIKLYDVEKMSERLLFTEDYIARDNGDGSLTPYEVICADDNVFVIAPSVWNADSHCNHVDFDRLEAYSNKKCVNTLDDLHFIKLDKKG